MTLPVANAGSDQSFAYSGVPFNVGLNGSASYDPDLGSIVAYRWTLIDKPPGSSASLLNDTTVTPTLQNVDKEGTYLVFLEVTDDNTPPESSEPDHELAPDIARVHVRHRTRYHDWTIPAEGERFWADFVYAIWMDVDDYLLTTGVWDTTHQLIFTTGNSPLIYDNRPAVSKAGECGLCLRTTTGVNFAAGVYRGLYVSPGYQQGAGDPTPAIFADNCDNGASVNLNLSGISAPTGFYASSSGTPTELRGLVLEASNAAANPGTLLEYVGSSGTAAKLRSFWDSYLSPAWGASAAIPTGSRRFGLATWFLTVGHIIADLRPGAYQAGANDGVLRAFTNIDVAANAWEQDVVLQRVFRQDVGAATGGLDFGLMWRESAAELVAGPPDPDIYPERTYLMRRPDAGEWSVPGFSRVRTSPSDYVPLERPGWLQGVRETVNPPVGDAVRFTVDVGLPAGMDLDITDGKVWCHAWSVVRTCKALGSPAYDEDLNVVALPLAGGAPGTLRLRVRFNEPHHHVSGTFTHNQGSPPAAGFVYGGTVTLATPIYVGPNWASHLSVQLTFFADGTITPPTASPDLLLWAIDSVTVDGSSFLRSFDYLLQPRIDADLIPTISKAFYTITAERRFNTADEIDLHYALLGRIDN